MLSLGVLRSRQSIIDKLVIQKSLSIVCVIGYRCKKKNNFTISVALCCIYESFNYEQAIFVLSLSCRQHVWCMYVAARFVSYLTVATLTSVAFLRSNKMRKLPASEEQGHQRWKVQHPMRRVCWVWPTQQTLQQQAGENVW